MPRFGQHSIILTSKFALNCWLANIVVTAIFLYPFFFLWICPTFLPKTLLQPNWGQLYSYFANGFSEAQTLPLKSFSFPKIFYSSQGWDLILHHNLFVAVSLKLWCKQKSIMTDDETHWLLSFLCSNINIPGVCIYVLSLWPGSCDLCWSTARWIIKDLVIDVA